MSDPIRVLVADDQPLVRAGVSALLDAEPDIEVVAVASDGAEALELARSTVPDVACLDIRMPVHDGITVTRALCGPDADPAIPVLVLTARSLSDDERRQLAAMTVSLLEKSEYSPAQLRRLIRQALGRHPLAV